MYSLLLGGYRVKLTLFHSLGMGQVYTLPLGGYGSGLLPPHLGKYRVRFTLFYSLGMGQAYTLLLGGYRVRFTLFYSVGIGSGLLSSTRWV